MNRRSFFKHSFNASLLAGSYAAFSAPGRLLALGETLQESNPVDLVAVKGGEVEAMFDKGIAAFGGIRAFVKKGEKVVIKPNIGWDVPPERGGNTSPKLVAHIIKQCLDAGAKGVYVFDHTCDDPRRCYKTSGIEAAVKDAGGVIAPGHSESYYHDVSVAGGKSLQKAKVHELILESDVFINVPILKNHSSTKITMGMKNLMGVVWDRQYWHANDVHQCIADFAAYRKPDLNVLDAYLVLKRNGPRGVSVDDVVTMKTQVLSRDLVATDAAGAKLFGLNPDDVRHIKIAADQKVGRKDLDKLNIKRISL